MKTSLLLTIVLALSSAAFAQESKQNPKQAIEHLMERARDAKAAGRHDEARELAGQVEKLQHSLREHEGIKKQEKHTEKKSPMPGKGPEAERMDHIMQAIQHLRAAALHEPAKGIEEIAHHIRREMEERMRREHTEAHERHGKHPEDMKPNAELEEMRQQMRRMAEQIERLQMEMKKRGE